MGENVDSLALILGLRHLSFYFLNIGCYFASICSMVAEIQAKNFFAAIITGFMAVTVLF